MLKVECFLAVLDVCMDIISSLEDFSIGFDALIILAFICPYHIWNFCLMCVYDM